MWPEVSGHKSLLLSAGSFLARGIRSSIIAGIHKVIRSLINCAKWEFCGLRYQVIFNQHWMGDLLVGMPRHVHCWYPLGTFFFIKSFTIAIVHWNVFSGFKYQITCLYCHHDSVCFTKFIMLTIVTKSFYKLEKIIIIANHLLKNRL